MGNALGLRTVIVTIASSGTASAEAVIPRAYRAVGIEFPAMTGTAVTVSACSVSGGTFTPLSALNTAVSFTVDSTGKYIGFTADVAAAFQSVSFFKLTSGSTELAARTIYVQCVEREC